MCVCGEVEVCVEMGECVGCVCEEVEVCACMYYIRRAPRMTFSSLPLFPPSLPFSLSLSLPYSLPRRFWSSISLLRQT